jgi:hypothetical protein
VQMLVDRVELGDLPVVGRASFDVLKFKRQTCAGRDAPGPAVLVPMDPATAGSLTIRFDDPELYELAGQSSLFEELVEDFMDWIEFGRVWVGGSKVTLNGACVTTGPHGYAHPASIYPATVDRGPAPSGDWVGTDETGYTSAQLKARIIPLGDGKWWAQMGDEWVGDYDGITEYPTARMAREQVEMKRKEQQDA